MKMAELMIENAQVYANGHFERMNVLMSNGKITALGDDVSFCASATRVDGRGYKLIPGLIDAHTHGGAGVDVNAADADGLKRIAAFFASQGVTAWNASVLTDTEETTMRCIDTINQVCEEHGYGAQLLGVHLEGPFLNPEYKGAMPEHLLRKGDAALVQRYLCAAKDHLRYMTVAPEIEGVMQVIEEYSDRIVFAIGHSAATYDVAMEAFRKGARSVTHTFNGMRLFHQHEPAIMGAALESDAWCEAICDGRHLHPGTVRMLLKCKGMKKVIAITDSIMAAGLPDGNYKLGVNDIIVENGDARLAHGNSRAGSTLTMIQALRNLIRFTGKSLEEIIPLFTENVAAALRLDDRKGRIAVGFDADLVLLNDELDVCTTIVGGEIVYSSLDA